MAAPKGNTFAAKDRRWKAAVDAALDRRSRVEGVQELERIAEKLIDMAKAGDLGAIREIGDRLDGKAIQQVDANITAQLEVVELRRYADKDKNDPKTI